MEEVNLQDTTAPGEGVKKSSGLRKGQAKRLPHLAVQAFAELYCLADG